MHPEYTEFKFVFNRATATGSSNIAEFRVLATGRAFNPATGRRDLVEWPFPYCVGENVNGVPFGEGDWGWQVVAYAPALRNEGESGYDFMISQPAWFRVGSSGPGAAICDVSLATSSTNGFAVQAFSDPSCAGPPAAALRIQAAGLATLRGIPLGRPCWIRAGRDSDCQYGFVEHGRRPIPVYAEPAGGPLSITNRIVIRDCR